MDKLSTHHIQPIVLSNNEGIDRIAFRLPLYGYCPLGADKYTAIADVTMKLGSYYPEHTSMFKFIEGMCAFALFSNPHTLEQLVFEVGDWLLKTYSPKSVEVRAHTETIDGKEVEFPLEITKIFRLPIDNAE